jgi:hypothetical protein
MLPTNPAMHVAPMSGAFKVAFGYIFGANERINVDRMEIELDRLSYLNSANQKEAQGGRYLRRKTEEWFCPNTSYQSCSAFT